MSSINYTAKKPSSIHTSLKASALKNADITTSKGVVGIDSILVNEYPGWELDFLRTSFYLPVQVLRDGRWVVEPIKVVTGEEFASFIDDEDLTANWTVKVEGATKQMLTNSKFVGLSARCEKATGKRTMLCKLWYGRA